MGRGLDALIPQGVERIIQNDFAGEVDINTIVPNRLQPRRTFDYFKLMELSASFKKEGILQPLVVIKQEEGYMIVAGERRLRAAKMAGLEKVPVRVLPPMDDTRLLRLALIENLQREDLNPIEAAHAYKQLIEKHNLSQAQLSDELGKSRPAISNTIRLLSLPDEVKILISENKLTEGHARALLSLREPQEQIDLARRFVDDSVTVREAEQVTRKPRKRRLIPKTKDINIREAETFLKRKLSTSVKIKPGLKKGSINIEYYGAEDLNRLLDIFQTLP
ncbi:MAG: ParB/RepB/Spo0J family partition protein [candidate division Zixibacteria bacterium]|nr:ParB/RepB/Spo0J family partition protein [candidate division Zixibacteria bacterium]